MTKKDDFNALVELAMSAGGHNHMRPVVEKELLHYDILFALDKENLLDRLTFQGGTSLRLCHGAARFSEDLDFAGGKDFSTAYLMNMKSCIEKYIGDRYGLEVTVKEPKEMKKDPYYQELKVDKWQISITTSPEKRDLPKQRIKLEVANIPAYSQIPKALQINYDFLPDGYKDTLIMTETLEEVMSDKIVSVVNCQKYIRYRDIWDLHWLKQQGATPNIEFIQNKIDDYSVNEYQKKLDERLNNIDEIVNSKTFLDEMSRFTPMEVQERTLQKDKFIVFLSAEIKELLRNVKQAL